MLPAMLPLYQVDAFTDRPFSGNPAAVCLLAEPREPAWMQAVAVEMALSETAFLVPRPEGDGWNLRWFTPNTEVALCGHATLASAHALWESGRLAATATARFHTLSGWLTAERQGEWIELDFPAKLAVPLDPEEPVAGLVAALGAEPLWIGKNQFDYLAVLPSAAALRSLAPDLERLLTLPVRGLIATALSDTAEFDFLSRFFAPAVGVPEDPVTGSAHCCLAPYWSGRLGKDELTGYQASARGGVVRVRVEGDRVKLGGQAVTVLRGELAA